MSTNPRPQEFVQRERQIDHDHLAITATGTTKLFKADRKWRLDRAQLVNPTGLAADAVNFFVIELKQGAVVLATWSTEVGQEGALVAATFVDLVLSATVADLVLDPDQELSLVFTENGTQTLPLGRVQIEGRYIK